MEALHVPSELESRWRALDSRVHAYLSRFLSFTAPGELPDEIATIDTAVPPTFHADLIGGGPLLRAAFPGLVRAVVAIDGGDHLVVRIACEGVQDGPFFGFMLATGRRVRFEEVHCMTIQKGKVVVDNVTIDMRLIIRQLADARTSARPAH